MAESTLLEQLRSMTLVDCDTLDSLVAERLGPFEDCTSNQAIAYHELQRDVHRDLFKLVAGTAKESAAKYEGISTAALAVELSTVALCLRMVPFVKGFVHVQTNPFDAYSTSRTIAGAQRLVKHFRNLEPSFDTSRVCIKVPSTWEGLQACRELEALGIATLATTLFTMEQAAVAGQAGCRYIAPYVHDLRAQIQPKFHDPAPIYQLCVDAQRYFEAKAMRTRVLAASLTSVAECMSLSGINHITIAPPLLEGLCRVERDDDVCLVDSFFKSTESMEQGWDSRYQRLIDDEAAFRMAFTRSSDGYGEIKQIHALNIFCKMQTDLEELLQRHL